MDSSTCVTSVPEVNSCELNVSSHCYEKSDVKKEQDALVTTTQHVPFDVDVNVTVPIVGVDVPVSINVSKCREQTTDSSSKQKNTNISNEIRLCQNFHQALSFDPKGKRCFSRASTFPSTKERGSVSLIAFAKHEQSDGSETSAYARSMSLPTLKLVSAMKGGRAQNGTSPTVEMRVKWASDVYDPPCTTVSHTVNNHGQRYKPKKKDNRKKKNKGKTSKGNGSNAKKNSSQKYAREVPDPSHNGLQPSIPKIVLDGYSKSEVIGHAFGRQEANCATSFLREVLPTMHLPVGEAS